jgi:tetratricopeptide (TPR) repeat protein
LNRRGAALLLALFAAALAVRLVYFHQMSGSPLWDHPVLDEAYNDDWAVRLAAGEGSPEIPYFRAPLYPWLLGIVYRVAGRDLDAARLCQAVLSGLSCLLVAGLARDLYGRLAGIAAGLLAATYWPWIYFDGELQDVPLTLFLDLAALALALRAGPGRSGVLAAGGAGVALGLSAIARPTVLVAATVVALWVWWGDGGSRRAGPAAALLLGLVLPILPVAATNVLVGGDAVLIASQGGVNFYIGNNPESDGRSARLPGAPAEWRAMLDEARRRAERAAGRPLRPSEVSRHWFREGIDYWLQQPGDAAAGALRKTAHLLSAPELANNKQIVFFTTAHAPILRFPWPGFGLVAPLALLGLAFGGGGRRAALVAGAAAANGAAVVAFFVASRFRMPFAVLLLPLAGGGVQALWGLRRAPGARRAGVVTLLAAGAGLCNAPSLWHREDLAHAHYTIGNAYEARGRLEPAIAEFRLALRERPGYRVARRDLAAALIAAGRAGEVVEEIGPQVRADPEDVGSRINLAAALGALGRSDEARAELEGLARLAADDPEVWIRLGNARAASGDAASAAAAFETALALDPDSAAARYNLGNARLALGDAAAAERHYRDLLRRQPDHAHGWHNLGVALARSGRHAAAAAAVRRALALSPADVDMRITLGQILAAAGDRAAARAELLRAAAAAPPGSEARRRAAEALQAGGED